MKLSRRLHLLVYPVLIGAVIAVGGVAVASTSPPAAASAAETPIVFGWGVNDRGQVGNGSFIDQLRPTPVAGQATDVIQVAVGSSFSIALHADGTVWTWGSNGSGQLGDGSTGSRAIPAQVPGLPGIKWVAAGAFFALAVGTDGSLWA